MKTPPHLKFAVKDPELQQRNLEGYGVIPKQTTAVFIGYQYTVGASFRVCDISRGVTSNDYPSLTDKTVLSLLDPSHLYGMRT